MCHYIKFILILTIFLLRRIQKGKFEKKLYKAYVKLTQDFENYFKSDSEILRAASRPSYAAVTTRSAPL